MEKNKKSERISKVIARSTPYSRRQVEQLIYDGRIRIDGKIIDKPGINVSKENTVQLDKKNIPFNSIDEIYLFHKPRGCLVTHSDPRNRKTIANTTQVARRVLQNRPSRLYQCRKINNNATLTKVSSANKWRNLFFWRKIFELFKELYQKTNGLGSSRCDFIWAKYSGKYSIRKYKINRRRFNVCGKRIKLF